jgi:hypothetical protein
MKVVVSKYVSDMKRKLDDAFSGSMPHLSSQSLCGEVAVFVVHMPERFVYHCHFVFVHSRFCNWYFLSNHFVFVNTV